MITHRFNNKLQILEVFYTGCIGRDELMSFGNWISENRELPRVLKILTDASGAEYKIFKNDFNEIMVALEYNCQFYKTIKAAFIQHKPNETAYSTLVSYKNRIPNYSHAVFYTREAAIGWLLFV